MKKIVGLRVKIYAYLIDDDSEHKKGKGTKKCVIKREDTHGHTTSNRRRFNVDITSIRRRPNFDEFPRRFHVLF